MHSSKASTRKILGGKKAKSKGDVFELILSSRAKSEKISFVKIPSGCAWRKTNFGVKPVPVRTPFDFVIGKNAKAVFFDAKCMGDDRFTYSLIKQHQVQKLLELEQQNFRSGYVIFFDTVDRVEFFSASQLMAVKRRESLKSGEGMFLGSIQNFSLLPLLDTGV